MIITIINNETFYSAEDVVAHRVTLLLLCDTHLRKLIQLNADNIATRSSEAVKNCRKRFINDAKEFNKNNKLTP